MAEHRREAANRRPLITGVVAGCVLCGVWLLPSAHAGHDDGTDGSSTGVEEPAEQADTADRAETSDGSE